MDPAALSLGVRRVSGLRRSPQSPQKTPLISKLSTEKTDSDPLVRNRQQTNRSKKAFIEILLKKKINKKKKNYSNVAKVEF